MFERLPHRFGDRGEIAAILAAHGGLEAGEESGSTYRVAGRVMVRRGQGKVAFLVVEDRSGRIQVMAQEDVLGEEFAAVRDLRLGDIVGVEGEAIRTRRGELSLRATSFVLLAPCQEPLPDKQKGLTDVEQRYRQRYLDLLLDADVRDLFVRRARMITALRTFMDGEGFIEVETPVLQPLYGGANARPFVTHHNALGRDLYLRIATELYLKRLIVGGMEKVYEIGKDFRNEGLSFKHNPEFTMMESYEAYADVDDVMAMVERLIAAMCEAATGSTTVEVRGQRVDVSPPWPRIPLGRAIAERCGLDPMEGPRDPEALRARLQADGVDTSKDVTWAALVDKALSHYVEPHLVAPVYLVDYPVELSPLARRSQERPDMVERFEAFMGGMEIANGFSELNDPDDQLARFEEQAAAGRAGDEEAHPVDHDYVHALRFGMPPTGGVGVGVDRLAILFTGSSSIREVMLFPAMRDRPGT